MVRSSRIFVRGLPPTFTESEFRSHFAQKHEVTDARLIPHRRIGYVGYKTPELAEAAVKYFNKSFIRMSKIGVEIAKSVSVLPSLLSDLLLMILTKIAESRETPAKSRRSLPMSTTSPITSGSATHGPKTTLKRKRDDNALAEPQPNKKLQEFLDVMRPNSKSNTWSNEDHTATVSVAVDEKDDDYTDFPEITLPQPNSTNQIEKYDTERKFREPTLIEEPNEEPAGPISDADWLRSKTSRLLDLTDNVETILEQKNATIKIDINNVSPENPLQPEAVNKQGHEDDHLQIPSNSDISEFEKAIEIISQSGRLFIRNLSYTVTEDDIRQHFSAYGDLQEVSRFPFHLHYYLSLFTISILVMKTLIGTSYIYHTVL
jgi:multiple RNA-binding domain-containing protein 1